MNPGRPLPADGQHNTEPGDTALPRTEVMPPLSGSAGWQHFSYLTGCRDLDERVFLGPGGGLSGGVVGISADGDSGLLLSLQIIARHLHADPAATARLVTTHSVAHVVRLLRGVLAGGGVTDKATRPELLRRVLISRIYAPDDLWAVLEELESAVPVRRLWSVTMTGGGSDDNAPNGQRPPASAPASATEPRGLQGSNGTLPCSSIIVVTEIDHHFKWMRLQGPHGLRLHELYGQLMRRLRALASVPDSPRPLILVLNSTVAQKPWGEPARVLGGEAAGGDEDDCHTSVSADTNEGYETAASLLQQQRGQPPDATAGQRADARRLCYREISRSQNVAPRYKSFMDYMCTLHVCFTQVPSDAAHGPTLWVVTVENDEAEIFNSDHERFGVVQLSNGELRDAFPAGGEGERDG